MQKLKKFFIVFLFFIFLFLIFLSLPIDKVYAEDDIYTKESEVSLEEFWNEYNNIYGYENFKYASASSLPVSYDLRMDNPLGLSAHGNITLTAENQGSEGLCWVFASLGALRSHLAVKGVNSSNNINLSEWHLNYLESKLFYDEYGSSRELGSAGSFSRADNYFKYNNGPVFETRFPYNTKIDISNTSELQKLDDLKPDYYVHQTLDFADITKVRNLDDSITLYNGLTTTTTENELNSLRNKIKEHIMNNGGLYADIKNINKTNKLTNITTTVSKNGKNYYNSGYIYKNLSSVNYLISGSRLSVTGHAVTIIGWDDNYSKDNFKCATFDSNGKLQYVTPKNNGAYIALNSYGVKGSSTDSYGVSYISYEDYDVEYGLYGYISVDTNPKYKTYTFSNQNEYLKMKQNISKSFLLSSFRSNSSKIAEKEKILINNGVIKCNDSSKKLEVLDYVANDFPGLYSIDITSQ